MTKHDGLVFINAEMRAIVLEEGDGYEFVYRDIKAQMRRNNFGAWCGYIKTDGRDLAIWHDFDVEYEVHGGWTYDRDGLLGFDCAHLGDMSPLTVPNFPIDYMSVYRNAGYVKSILRNTINAYYRVKEGRK